MKTILILALIGILIMINAAAQPSLQPPHQYYGDVLVNGVAAEDGLLVVAKIDGNDVAAGTTEDGKYGQDGKFYVTDPLGNRNGKTVEFHVQDEYTGDTAVFNSDTINTKVDLSLELADTTTSQTTSGRSGGGGGGGGSYRNIDQGEEAVETTETNDDRCLSDWVCSEWLECISGAQKRVCVDANRCDSGLRPDEDRECFVEPEILGAVQEEHENQPFNDDNINLLDKKEEKQSTMDFITGAVTGGGIGSWAVLIIMLLILGVVIFWFLHTRKMNKF